MLGTAYGAMFSLAPMVVLEWFGLARFSRNWGCVALSPVLGGNIFSLAFGRNLDRNAGAVLEPEVTSPGDSAVKAIGTAAVSSALGSIISKHVLKRGGLPDTSDHLCFSGLVCYSASLRMTMLACVAATMLSVWATLRDQKVYAPRERLAMAIAASAGVSGAATPAALERQENTDEGESSMR